MFAHAPIYNYIDVENKSILGLSIVYLVYLSGKEGSRVHQRLEQKEDKCGGAGYVVKLLRAQVGRDYEEAPLQPEAGGGSLHQNVAHCSIVTC